MAFLRRKSGVYHEDVYSEDFDVPRRRRLSKPLTKSATNLPSLSLQQRRKSTGRSVQDDATPFPPVESREAMKSHLFSLTSHSEMAKTSNRGSQVALLAARFEKAVGGSGSTSQLSLSSSKTTQRSLPQSLSRKTSVDQHDSSSNNSGSKPQAGNLEVVGVSPMSSSDQVIEDPAPPARRAASYAPGAATRVPGQAQETIQEETASVSSSRVITEENNSRILARSSTHEDWVPPPQNDRPVTPSDLEYAHIGRLGLGSLRITNGAVSPSPSDMLKPSKNYSHVGLRRNCSSVYAESEIGTVRSRKTAGSQSQHDARLSSEIRSTSLQKPEMYRSFSFNPGSEAVLSHEEKEEAKSVPANEADDDEKADMSGFLANEYIAELPMSPFAATSPPASPRITQIESQVSTAPTSLDHTLGEPVKPSSNIQNEPVTPNSQSSVRQHSIHTDSHHWLDTDQDTTGRHEDIWYAPPGFPKAPDSPASFFSMPDTDYEADDRFKSAVEIQPPRSRSRSPGKMNGSPLKEAHRAFVIPRRPLASKADSGYSSDNSLSLPPPMPDPSVLQRHRQRLEQSPERQALRLPSRKAVQSPSKPVLVRPTLSTKVPTPSTAQIESISALTSVASLHDNRINASQNTEPVSPTKAKDRIRNKLQKQRRKSTVEPARQVVVQRIVSMECFDVPAITNNARHSLALRAEALPELQGTYRTQDHTKNPNASTLTLARPAMDIRFPSPELKPEDQRVGRNRSQSRTRRRSLSRPRSWFGWSKEEKEKEEPRSLTKREVSEHLQEYGTVVSLLGTDPYDIARTTPKSSKTDLQKLSLARDMRPELMRRRTSPSNVAGLESRPRSMMDDESAKDFAKQRRLSNAEKRTNLLPRQSFDDRGGIPGKLPMSTRLSLDAPPLPPMPSADEINRRYSCKLGASTSQGVQPCGINSTNTHTQDDSQDLLLHSHFPQQINDQRSQDMRSSHYETTLPSAETHEYQQYQSSNGEKPNNSQLAEDFAPPPPSHSPHPIDVTDRQGRPRDVSWTGPANAWYARRRSASANLQDAFIETGHQDQQSASRPTSRSTHAYPHVPYSADYVSPSQEYQYTSPQEHSAPYHYYENGRKSSQGMPHEDYYQSMPAGGYDQWTQEQHPSYHQPQRHRQPRMSQVYPSHDAYRDFETPQPILVHRHTWQPMTQEIIHDSAQGAQRFYDEYNKGNIPQPGLIVNRRAHTYDEYQRPESRGSKQSRSRSRSRPTSRHSQHSRPVSRHSYHSQHHTSQVDEPLPHPYDRRSPRHDRYSGRIGYDPRLLPGRDQNFPDNQNYSAEYRQNTNNHRKKRASWLDMEAYGIDLEATPGKHMPVRNPADRMIYG